MGDKITSVAELKRAVKARRNPYQRDDAIGTGNFELLKCLELIGEFEAEIKERLETLKRRMINLNGSIEKAELNGDSNFLRYCELCRVLGEEEHISKMEVGK